MANDKQAVPAPQLALLPILLSLNAGYVDAAGFLALQGLFTAHVTGNFVTLGAALALGTTGIAAKLLALPVFCIGVLLTRLMDALLEARHLPRFRILLAIKIGYLTLGAVLAIALGPFPNGDTWGAILTGMVLVAAMSMQNAIHRLHLASAPPSTLMTGTTTQVMMDIAGLILGAGGDLRPAMMSRLRQMLSGIGAFAVGCLSAAALYTVAGMVCFVVPPLLALSALLLHLPGETTRVVRRA